jgi:hypothetical protein
MRNQTYFRQNDMLLMRVPEQAAQFSKVAGFGYLPRYYSLPRRQVRLAGKGVEESPGPVVEPGDDGLGEQRDDDPQEDLEREEQKAQQERDVFW